MNILEALVQLRDDLKTWVTNNLNALNKKIDEKTIPIDSELSATSPNPVQNKVINAKISSLNNLIGNTSVATQISTAIANQDLFSGDYNDLQNAPNILDDGSSNLKVSDEDGNIIAQIDADGLKTTVVTANSVVINGTDVSDDGSGKVELADENGNVIARVDNYGIHTTEIEADGIKIKETLSNHINNDNIHVTTEEKALWNNKSDFSGDYKDLTNAPNISEDEENKEVIIADEDGNIIFKVDENGAHATNVTASEVIINGKKVNESIGSIQSSVNNLNQLVGTKSVADQISEAVDDFESFGGDYNDLINAPNINNRDDKELFVADSEGNTIFRINETGIVTTDIQAQRIYVNGHRVLTEKDLLKSLYILGEPPSNLSDFGNEGDIIVQI